VARIKALMNDALEFIPVECMVPLKHGPDDGDMQDSGTTSWTAASCTIAKQTTAAEVLWGAQSTSLTATGAGGSATSTTMRTKKGEVVQAFTILKADTGEFTVRYLDQGATNLNEDVAVTEEDWTLVHKTISLESDDEGIAVSLIATSNNDQADVQASWFVKDSNNLFILPTWIDERFKLKAVSHGVMRFGAANAHQWVAAGIEYVTLREGDDYRFIARHADANPAWIELINSCWHSDPVFLTVECPASAPYGVAAVFTTDASTTKVPLHLLTSYTKTLLGRRYGVDVAKWKQLEALGEREYKERRDARKTERPSLMTWAGASGGVNI
jgi:hypothetical protein